MTWRPPTSRTANSRKGTFWSQLPNDGRWLLIATVVQTLGAGLTLPFTIIYLHEVRGIDIATASVLLTVVAVVALAVTGPCGHWIDRVGARRILLWGTVAGGLGVAGLALVGSTAWAALCFAFIGFSMGVTLPAKGALASSILEGELRSTYFAVNFAMLNLSFGLGGVVGGLFVRVDEPATFVAVFLADGALVLSTSLIIVGPLRDRNCGQQSDLSATPGTYRQVLARPGMKRLVLLAFVGTTIGYGQLESGIPVFARDVSEVSTGVIGLALALNALLIVTGQLWLLRRLDGHRRTRALVCLGGVWAIGWVILATTGSGHGEHVAAWGFVIFLVVFAVGEMIQQPLLPIITNDLAPEHLRGKYNAVQTGAFQAGGIAGPVIAGLLLHADLWWVYIAVMCAGCGLMATLAWTWERSIPAYANGVVANSTSAA